MDAFAWVVAKDTERVAQDRCGSVDAHLGLLAVMTDDEVLDEFGIDLTQLPGDRPDEPAASREVADRTCWRPRGDALHDLEAARNRAVEFGRTRAERLVRTSLRRPRSQTVRYTRG
jgi:hypothetical protein